MARNLSLTELESAVTAYRDKVLFYGEGERANLVRRFFDNGAPCEYTTISTNPYDALGTMPWALGRNLNAVPLWRMAESAESFSFRQWDSWLYEGVASYIDYNSAVAKQDWNGYGGAEMGIDDDSAISYNNIYRLILGYASVDTSIYNDRKINLAPSILADIKSLLSGDKLLSALFPCSRVTRRGNDESAVVKPYWRDENGVWLEDNVSAADYDANSIHGEQFAGYGEILKHSGDYTSYTQGELYLECRVPTTAPYIYIFSIFRETARIERTYDAALILDLPTEYRGKSVRLETDGAPVVKGGKTYWRYLLPQWLTDPHQYAAQCGFTNYENRSPFEWSVTPHDEYSYSLVWDVERLNNFVRVDL